MMYHLRLKRRNDGLSALPFVLHFASAGAAISVAETIARTRPDLEVIERKPVAPVMTSEGEAMAVLEAVFGPAPVSK